jgi:microcystin-dependent protein
VFLSVVAMNPATLLGLGTWVAFGAGRVLVGRDAGDADFDTAEETGGEKTHTLTEAEIPSHAHAENAPASASGGALKLGIDSNASGSQAAGLNTGAAGGGGAHNNLQPYIVVYMWKRTA